MTSDKRPVEDPSQLASDELDGRTTKPLIQGSMRQNNDASMDRKSREMGDAPTILPRDSRRMSDAPTVLPRDSGRLGDAATITPRESRELNRQAQRARSKQSSSAESVATQLKRPIPLDSQPTLPPLDAADERDASTRITGRDAPTRPSMRGEGFIQGESNLRGGDLVGRYVVLGVIGAGGMGIVYLAYDPELDRRVALKVLRPEFSHLDTVGPSLLQEAKSMARLQDPNVCTVYEVGTAKKLVFIAMEYIDGETLSGWLESKPRTWKEVVEVMIQAGRGLDAAHRNGIVHRDFKPDNIMIDQSGRVRVMDFGVSETAVRKPGTRQTPDEDAPRRDNFSSLVVGTPGYMAPEQLNAKPVDQRCDQFSYCATLYKTLYGQLPYQGHTLRELREAFENNTLVETENPKGVPHWLRQIILRGISIDPDKRFPSVGNLVEQLLLVPRRRHMMAYGALAAIVLLAVVGTTVLLAGRSSDRPKPCRGANDRVATVWNSQIRGQVQQGLLASGLPNAERMWNLVDDNMSRYTSNWVTMHTDACEATRVRGEQSTEMLDLRMLCLDGRLREVKALAAVLAEGDRDVAQHGAEAVLALSDLSRCQARQNLLLADPEPDDPTVKQRLNEMRGILATVKARYDAASYRDALPVAEKLTEETSTVGYGPFTAEAQLMLGKLRGKLGELEKAEATLIDAVVTAKSSGAELFEAEALIALVRYIGWEGGNIAAGWQWARFAEAVLIHTGGDSRLQARLARRRSALYYQEGNYQASYELNKQALDIALRALGEDDPDVIDALINVSGLDGILNDVESGIEKTEKAAKEAERVLGEGHPMVAEAINNMANLYVRKGDLELARDNYQRAMDIWEGSLGADHPSISIALNNLGRIADADDETEEAIALYERALAIEEKSLGKDHRKSAITLASLGAAYLNNGNLAKAQPILKRALKVFGDSEEVGVAETRFSLARVLRANGDRKRAFELARQARKLWASHGSTFAEAVEEVDEWLLFPD